MNSIIIITLGVIGLIFGSFINALVWRLHQTLDSNGTPKKLHKKSKKQFSMLTGRSMCDSCKHQLTVADLLPLVSWVLLRGKCRYCHSAIDAQNPIVELVTAVLFIVSYVAWPFALVGIEWIVFVGYVYALVFLIALAVYDMRWFILPSSLIYNALSVYFVAILAYAVIEKDMYRFGWAFISAIVYVGIFAIIYFLPQLLYKGKKHIPEWIGFGDVRLAPLLGFIIGYPSGVFVAMFLASITGILVALPGILTKKVHLITKIPFGPYLIIGTLLAVWFGQDIMHWYNALLVGS